MTDKCTIGFGTCPNEGIDRSDIWTKEVLETIDRVYICDFHWQGNMTYSIEENR